MKRHFLIAATALFFILSSASVFASPAYDHSLGDETMSFQWRLDAGKNLIYVKLTGKTDSWVSVGFNPTRRMKGANFVMGYVKNGKVKATDHFGVDIFMHKKRYGAWGNGQYIRAVWKRRGGIHGNLLCHPFEFRGFKRQRH